MSLLASAIDFEQVLYSGYERYPYFGERAAALVKSYGPKRFLVVGAGFGFLLDELDALGATAHGVELSEYAIRRCHALVPAVYSRMHKIDARDSSAMRRLGRFDVVVTEDILPTCSLEEVPYVLEASRSVGGVVVHIVTAKVDESKCDPRILNLPLERWLAICYPDRVIDQFGNNHA